MTRENRMKLLLTVSVLTLIFARPAWASFYVYTSIDFPGATGTFAFGVNDAGQVVGEYVDTTGRHGFSTLESSFSTIDFPKQMGTQAFGINGVGQIVGDYTDGSF